MQTGLQGVAASEKHVLSQSHTPTVAMTERFMLCGTYVFITHLLCCFQRWLYVCIAVILKDIVIHRFQNQHNVDMSTWLAGM